MKDAQLISFIALPLQTLSTSTFIYFIIPIGVVIMILCVFQVLQESKVNIGAIAVLAVHQVLLNFVTLSTCIDSVYL